MRPADLVGAIAGEAGLDSSRIGAIHIADMYSIVEVPEPDAARIITALSTLRGKKVSCAPRHPRLSLTRPPPAPTGSPTGSHDGAGGGGPAGTSVRALVHAGRAARATTGRRAGPPGACAAACG